MTKLSFRQWLRYREPDIAIAAVVLAIAAIIFFT